MHHASTTMQCDPMRYDTIWCTVAAVVDVLAQDGHQEMDAKRCKEIKTKNDKNKEAAGKTLTLQTITTKSRVCGEKKTTRKREREKETKRQRKATMIL